MNSELVVLIFVEIRNKAKKFNFGIVLVSGSCNLLTVESSLCVWVRPLTEQNETVPVHSLFIRSSIVGNYFFRQFHGDMQHGDPMRYLYNLICGLWVDFSVRLTTYRIIATRRTVLKLFIYLKLLFIFNNS